MLYVDGYALEIVISTFNDCELDKAIHLSKASQHLGYFMDIEFESTGQLLYRFSGYCLITLEVIFPFLKLQQAIYQCGLYTSVTVRIRPKENTVF